MKRRIFLQKSALATTCISCAPHSALTKTINYTIEELMGKADVALYGEGINLRNEAHVAFLNMKKAAYKDGFDIKMISSFRDFYKQQSIWERKYIRYTERDDMTPLEAIEKIIEYSTIPGTSRHHWGTDIDIVDGYQKVSGDVLDPNKFEGDGPYAPFKDWLDKNANKHGFYIVYTDNPERKGFKYEPWHYSFAPISRPMLKAYRQFNIMKLLGKEDFLGCEHFTREFVKTYIEDNILDINPVLL
jgi:LAS superfamily LD-carboxypeptidase LdcB